MKKIINFVLCKLFGLHEWTCAYNEGVKPTKEQLDKGFEGFKEYSKMYCSRCGKESKLNLK